MYLFPSSNFKAFSFSLYLLAILHDMSTPVLSGWGGICSHHACGSGRICILMFSSGLENLWPYFFVSCFWCILSLLCTCNSNYTQAGPFTGFCVALALLIHTAFSPSLSFSLDIFSWQTSHSLIFISRFFFFFSNVPLNYSIKFLVSVIFFISDVSLYLKKFFFPVLCVVPQSVIYFLQHNEN